MDETPPVVGSVDEPDGNGDEETGGVVLYNPPARSADLPPEERTTSEPPVPPSRKVMWILTVLAVLVSVGGYFGVTTIAGRTGIDEAAQLPPMVPSMIGGGAPNSLAPTFGRDIRATVGSTVQVGVRATGESGAPLSEALVRFRVESGGGALQGSDARTDVRGDAATLFTLPEQPGQTVIIAEVPESEIPPTSLLVTARAGSPVNLTLVSGEAQTGGAGDLLPSRVAVRVTDEHGNPVPGVRLNFRIRSGDGVAAPTQVTSDSLGLASALWRLGLEAGNQQLAATSTTFAEEIVFSANALPRVEAPTDNIDRMAGIIMGPVTVSTRGFVVGGSHVCSLDTMGAATCRGATERGQGSASGPVPFTSLTSGLSHLCGLSADGIAYCWGSNESGQLGDGSTNDQSTPLRVRTELRFSTLSAGAGHTCGLSGGGIPACWGLNLSGQLGDGSRNDQTGPRTVGGGLTFRRLVAGWNHTCGVTGSGNVFCWGANSQGQLGDGSRLDRLVPTRVRGSMSEIVAGSFHTCGIAGSDVLCWGGNGFGQLGDGTRDDKTQPVEVLGLPSTPTELTAGGVHTCALLSDGQAFCWGQNRQGQLGDGTNEDRSRATPVAGGLRFDDIEAGGALTCGTATDGARYCWGLNGRGQLGDGTRVSRSTPTRVGG